VGCCLRGAESVADAEQVEGLALEWGWARDEQKPGRVGSAGWNWLRQMVARSLSRVWKLCTGRLPSMRLVAALARARGAGGGGDRAVPDGPGGWLVIVGEQDGREPALHLPGDVVGGHPQEHVGADPSLGAAADEADVQDLCTLGGNPVGACGGHVGWGIGLPPHQSGERCPTRVLASALSLRGDLHLRGPADRAEGKVLDEAVRCSDVVAVAVRHHDGDRELGVDQGDTGDRQLAA
jgi:hypothetical protein